MKKFFLWIAAVILITLFADRTLAYFMADLYEKCSAETEYKVRTSIDHEKVDVVFMGASTCHFHYMPSVISKEIGMSCYNAGLTGFRNIYYQYCLLNIILEKYTPRVIIYENAHTDIYKTPESGLEKIDVFSPYVGRFAVVDSMFKKSGNYFPCKFYHLYQYNSQIFDFVVYFSKWYKTPQSDDGFLPIHHVLQAIQPASTDALTNANKVGKTLELDSDKIFTLKKFITLCKQKKIMLIMVASPTYYAKPYSKDPSLKATKEIISNMGVKYIDDYYVSNISGNAMMYADYVHLNSKGAECYSRYFGKQLKRIIDIIN